MLRARVVVAAFVGGARDLRRGRPDLVQACVRRGWLPVEIRVAEVSIILGVWHFL
jgi:hypothetical protein